MTRSEADPSTTDASPVDQFLDDADLSVVSNREPYSHEYGDDGGIEVSDPVGGLTAALDPVLQDLGGTWVAWGSGDADPTVVDEEDHVAVPPDDPAYDLRRVWLDDADVDGYYYGFSNRVLWPLCHGLPSKVSYDPAYWRAYRRVNDRFADAVVDEVDGPNSVVWLHDYHFGVAPRRIRRRLGRGAFLAQFWHIPWPSWDVFRRCPHGTEVLDGLLNNDLVGLHTEHDRRQFVRCAEAALDATYDPARGALYHDGRRTVVRAAPIQRDASAVRRRAESDAAASFWEDFATEHGLDDRRVAVGVDRLDYTKGIVQRLDALELLWERYPEYRGDLTFVQKGTESRSRIDEYRAYQERVADKVRAINDRFGTDDWQPVVYLTDHLPREHLAGLYRHADLALVSPLRDGRNLVAEEYVAAQVDADGVLVLSETAGVADELGDQALTVTPRDGDDVAETVRRGLELPERDRRERMRALQNTVRDSDGTDWVRDLFRSVVEAADPDEEVHARAV